MELRLNPWQRFLLVAAMLAIAVLFTVHQGGVAWYMDRFSDPATLWSTAFILVIFFTIFLLQGGGGALLMQREVRALRLLQEHGFAAVTSASGSHLAIVLNDFEQCAGVTSVRKMKVDPFVEYYETVVAGPINALTRSKEILVTLGILGTVAGITLGLSSADDVSVMDAKGVQQYTLAALQGVALSYTTTLFALFGALIIYYLAAGFQPVVDRMVATFGVALERELLVRNKLEGGDDGTSS